MKQIIDASPWNCVLSLNSQKHNNVSGISKYSQTQGVIFGVVMQSQEMGLMILASHSDSGYPMILCKFVVLLAVDYYHLYGVPDPPLFALHL